VWTDAGATFAISVHPDDKGSREGSRHCPSYGGQEARIWGPVRCLE
jgi:hypothetical protein